MSRRVVALARWGLFAAVAAALLATGCSENAKRDVEEAFVHLDYYENRDMRRTVAIKPQKAPPRSPDSLSVPLQGKERIYSRDYLDANWTNPLAYDDSVFARGERKFMRVCSPCHGKSTKGDGPVAAKLIPPPSLLGEVVRGRSDGYIYSYIRNGGAVMPDYGAIVSVEETWEIIHYIREMQKRNPQ